MTDKALKPPSGLQSAGQRLWKSIMADVGPGWRLDARDLHLLERACRIDDELRQLEQILDDQGLTTTGSRGQQTIHPCLAEARQLRQVQQRLLGAIELCDPATGSSASSSVHASRAAQRRWQRAG
jgi:P27 family predicted phage terminase small subunit